MLNLIFSDCVASENNFEVFSWNETYLNFDAKGIQKDRAFPWSLTSVMENNVFVINNKQLGDSSYVLFISLPISFSLFLSLSKQLNSRGPQTFWGFLCG